MKDEKMAKEYKEDCLHWTEWAKKAKDLEWQLKEVIKDNDYYQEENKRLEKELEKRIEQIEALNKDKDYFSDALDKQIEATLELQKENAELKEQVEQRQHLADVRLEQSLENYKLFSDERKARIDIDIALEDMLDKAKELIENIIRVTWGEGWNYSLDVKVKAEQFMKELEL